MYPALTRCPYRWPMPAARSSVSVALGLSVSPAPILMMTGVRGWEEPRLQRVRVPGLPPRTGLNGGPRTPTPLHAGEVTHDRPPPCHR